MIIRPSPEHRVSLFSYNYALSIWLCGVGAMLACYVCIASSLITHYDHVSNLTIDCHSKLAAEAGGMVDGATMEDMVNHLPAISWSVGVYNPQRIFWMIILILHMVPRIMMGPVLLAFHSTTNASYANHILYRALNMTVNVFLHVEYISLLVVSLVDIETYFHVHATIFVTWVSAFGIGMLLQTMQMHFSGWRHVMPKMWKFRLTTSIIGFIICVITPHVYIVYMETCSSLAYLAFSVGEYTIVAWNAIYYGICMHCEFANVRIEVVVHFDGNQCNESDSIEELKNERQAC